MELLVPAVAGPFTTSLHFTSPPLPAAAKTLLIPSKSAVSLKITRLTPVARASNDARSGRMLLLSAHASSSPGGTASSSAPPSFLLSPGSQWIVVTEKPPNGLSSKSEVIDYYVSVLTRVLGSEREAQMCIYDASWQSRSHFGFCCDIDEDAALQLAKLPGVLSVRRDRDPESSNKDYSFSSSLLTQLSRSDGCPSKFTHAPGVNSNYWLVQMEKPGVEVVTKAQMVDYYAQTLTKVLGNEKDAQASIYNISWEKEFGFCCHIDENCAAALADVPGVLSVRPDLNFDSENKDYRGSLTPEKEADLDSSNASQSPSIKTKRLFVTGLSFYTSEKTLRAAFEGYGELVEVKVIMDKISKRSKGYAFIEYTTEEAASAALKEMNGKIINGWMIVVDVAKTNPPRYSRGRPRPSASRVSSN